MSDDIKAVGVANEVYDSLLALVGAYVASQISKGLLKKSLGTPENIEGMVKLALAVGVGAAIVDMLQTKGYIPSPFGKLETSKVKDKTVEGKEIAHEIYESLLALVFAFIASRASKGIFHKSLGAPETIEGGVKLAVALGLGATLVTYLQEKGYVPDKVFTEVS